MYNKVTMIGNLTRDIELRYLPTGSALGKTAIATTYSYKAQTGEKKEEVCFIDLTFFGRSAEVANQYLKKGSKILVEGRLVFEQWTAHDGTNRSRHTLRVEEMKMLDSKKDSENNSGQGNYHAQYNNQSQGNSQGGYNPNQYEDGQGNRDRQQHQRQNYAEKIPEIDIESDDIPF